MSQAESAGVRPASSKLLEPSAARFGRLWEAIASSPGWIAALIALPVAVVLVTEFAGLATPVSIAARAPAVPQAWLQLVPEPQQPPSGTWTCDFAGEAVGTLTVTGWQYALGTTAAGEPQSGTLEPLGGRAGKNRATYVQVESGPLKDNFGIRLGIHDDSAKPENLIFNLGPGSGIRCVRT